MLEVVVKLYDAMNLRHDEVSFRFRAGSASACVGSTFITPVNFATEGLFSRTYFLSTTWVENVSPFLLAFVRGVWLLAFRRWYQFLAMAVVFDDTDTWAEYHSRIEEEQPRYVESVGDVEIRGQDTITYQYLRGGPSTGAFRQYTISYGEHTRFSSLLYE